ncbi:MAG: LysR family transcriptional regulator [Myxococcota bacterium]|jgi:DNA-binding transcriptional LysR family regulator
MKSIDLNSLSVDLNKLRTFFAIAECGGVSAAAQQLSLTRSAISHSLAGLESSLDVTLFHRVGKKLVPTREGALLRKTYAEIEQRITSALDEIRDDDPEVRGWIRLGLFVGFSRLRLSHVLEHFLGEYPQTGIRIVYGSRAELLDGLIEGRLDFGLALRGAPAPKAIRSSRLFDQQLVLACRDRPRGGPHFDVISRLSFVDFFRSEPLIDRWVAHHFGRRHRIDRSKIRVWAASSSDLALELARNGVGATVLPSNLVEPFRKRKELVVIRGPRAPLRDGIWLNELEGARPTRIQAAFRSSLFDRFG